MKIYLISLEQDKLRREVLRENFPQTYPEMQWIKAVNGKELSAKEYFFYSQQYFNEHQKIITPSEVGCTLSHIRALEAFLKTEENFCLILEDDVIGTDQDIFNLENLINGRQLQGVICLRDQSDFGFSKYIYGKKNKKVHELSRFSIKFIYGTCSYALDRNAARHLLKRQKQKIEVADAWYAIFRNSDIPFLYLNLFKHPEDLSNSHIENERIIFHINENNFFKRIYKEGVFWKISNRVRNDMNRWILILKGYKQIHRQKMDDD